MCPPRRPGDPVAEDVASDEVGRGPHLVALALSGLAVVAVVALLAGSGSAAVPDGAFQTNDTTEPTVGTLSKVNDTAVALEIVDDGDVDESTLDLLDFELSAGRLSAVAASEDGPNATATLSLATSIDRDTLTVSVADNASIEDAAGNALEVAKAPSRSVDGMDGKAPSVRTLDVTNESNGTIEIELRVTEQLEELFVNVNGPDSQVLDVEDFAKADGWAEYETTIQPAAAGEYRVRVSRLTDLYNNTRDVSVHETVAVDGTPPAAVAGIDFGASEGLLFTFDAGRTTDTSAIRNYTWDFGDGTAASGERVAHHFEPGNYTVTLEATDAHGNTGTDHLVLNLTNHNASIDPAELLGQTEVSVSSNPDDASGAAVVDVPEAAANETIHAGAGRGPIAAARSVSLRSMTVTHARNASYAVGVQIDGPAVVRDATAAANGTALAGLVLVHDVPDDAVRNVTLAVGVARDRLDEADEVRVYRYHNDSWSGLRTERLNGTDETAVYRVHSPGLSRFAVLRESTVAPGDDGTATPTATPTPTPAADVTVAEASLNETAIGPGGTVGVSARLDNRGDEPVESTAGLSVDGRVVDARSVSIPAGARRTVSFAYAPEDAGSYAVAVNGTNAGTLEVGGGQDSGPLSVLGFLPIGLLRTLATYVGGLSAVVYLVLKAAALYLGY